MQFRVLGPLEARTSDGRLLHLGAEKQRVLLAALLLSANQPVSADRLVARLWGERPPPSVSNALRTYVSTLRSQLRLGAPGSSSHIVAQHGAYQLQVADDDLDMLVFEQLTARGLKAFADGDPATAAEVLQRAGWLWRGRALEDVPVAGDLAADVSRLEELRLTGLEAWLDARLARGEHAEVLADARVHVAEHPLRERLQGSWMLALYRSGRQAEALDAYRALREHLVGELGIEPSRPVQRLHRQMLAADPALDPPDRDDGRPVVVPRQLPPDVAGFTGRDRELALVQLRIGPVGAGRSPGPPSIVVVDGVAGVGKSALAIHAAHQLADRFPDGHLYADLRGTTPGRKPAEPPAVLSAFLRALDAPGRDVVDLAEAAGRFRALTAGRRVLILLDNARDAAQIEPLLPAGNGCAVLVTSRRVLSTLDGSVRVHLEVLPAAEAATLLARRAGRQRVAQEVEAAAEVARLCGYLPLALRIAASRLAARPSWPVAALADRLAGAQRRLDELQVGDLGVRASFQVSLHALHASADPGERAAANAFTMLGVLDGCDVAVAPAARLLDQPPAAAEAALERLVDAHLLDSPAPGRYQLHDLLRLFARECAAESHSPAVRTAALVRVLSWYRAAARETLRLLRPGHQHPVLHDGAPGADLPFDTDHGALEWSEAERSNLVAAIQQGLADPSVPPDIPIATAQALVGFFEVRGYWLDWIGVNEAVLAAADRSGDPAAAGYARRDLGVAHELRGDYPRALTNLEAALDIFERTGERRGQAACLTSIAIVHHRVGKRRLAVDCNRRSLVIRRELGDERGEAINLSNMGEMLVGLGEYTEGGDCYRDALAIFQRLGDQPSAAQILTNLGVRHELEGRYADAIAWHERSLEAFRGLRDRGTEARVLKDLGRAYRLAGRHLEALARQQEGLAISELLGDRFGRAECLRELGATWQSVGKIDRARAHWERALAGFAELGVPEEAEVRTTLAGLTG